MASLSLPRVLHSKKSSLAIERENFERAQAQALSKAINNHETPVKQKHVRSAIIGTFHTQGAQIFWAIALRLPAMDDRIIAWKLCHVVHKILREGHPLCLVDSQKHIKELDEIGKLWVHLKEGYGKMIRLYTSLLMTKLDFHRKNPRFPGHLGVSDDELESIGGNDINNYFQITVEMFDYLDNIIELQAAVFGSLDMARSNSMTSAGQCRLAPLIPCIQDASKLYDYCVKIIFKLHYVLPPDILSGHRHRFLKQFKHLKQFYQNTSNLQYFKDLIAIPPLPENPPNFLIQADLRTYVTQDVVVPIEEPEEEHPAEGSLIDTSEPVDITDNSSNNSILAGPPIQDLINERDQLRGHCEKWRTELQTLTVRNQKIIEDFQNKITLLETDLATKESELVQERQIKEELVNQAFSAVHSQDSEQKAKEEKFNKLKMLYYKLRDDHIQKIRENADVGKKLEQTTKTLEDVEKTKVDLETAVLHLRDEVAKSEEVFQQSTQNNEKLEVLQRDKEVLNMQAEILRKSVNDVTQERDNLKGEFEENIKINECLHAEIDVLKKKEFELMEQFNSEKKNFALHLDNILNEMIKFNEDLMKSTVDELENPALTALTCGPDYLISLGYILLKLLDFDRNLLNSNHLFTMTTIGELTHRISVFILQGRATANKSSDINHGEHIANECKILGEMVLQFLQKLRNKDNINEAFDKVVAKVKEIIGLTEKISISGESAATLADMLDNEISEMDKAIEEAANKIQEMLNNSRSVHSGVKLEVNSKILDSCTNLMQAIRILVLKAKLLQAEIVAQGKGSASAKEFYKRNHQWTDGFISAAKSVAAAATFLVIAADKVVSSNGKLEQLVVAAQEIAASTAQLVVASRVKADRNSNNLQQLSQASKGVNQATGTIVGTVKDCSQLIEETEEFDTTKLTLHQAKQLEMESLVRVLELEKELELERQKLLRLRKHHYKLEEESGQ